MKRSFLFSRRTVNRISNCCSNLCLFNLMGTSVEDRNNFRPLSQSLSLCSFKPLEKENNNNVELAKSERECKS